MNGHASLNRIYRLVWSDVRQSWVVAPETARGRTKRNATVGTSAAPSGERTALHGLLGLLAVPLLGFGLGAYAGPAPAGYSPPATVIASTTLPTQGAVVAGSATISQSGSQMDISQSTGRAIIDWGTYNVGTDASVNYSVPTAASSTLNRVLDSQPSQILGRITSNGQVFLVNPNGVYFGKTASVDVGGLVATTNELSDADYLAGRTTFARNGATGSVVNEGQLRAALGGYIALLAPEVQNAGVIVAQLGTVALASGESVTLQFAGNHSLAGLIVEPSKIGALVANGGAVLAPGGVIILSAQALDRLQGGVVQNAGSLEATGMSLQGGRIVLSASDSLQTTGVVSADAGADGSPAGSIALATAGDASVAGSLTATSATGQGGSVSLVAQGSITLDSARVDASGATGGGSIRMTGGMAPATGDAAASPPTVALDGSSSLVAASRLGQGGTIAVTGAQVGLFDSATLDASGATGGGRIQVGGGLHGQDPALADATATYVAPGAAIRADATGQGDGGDVVVWANDVTHFLGAISAEGAGHGGHGGTVEVSGRGQLDFQGSVDTTAPDGAVGTLLLDPADLTISNAADSAVSAGSPFSPSGATSNLSVTTLQNTLATTDVTVQTGADAYAGSGNITVLSDFGWISKHNLTLNAYNNLDIAANVIDYQGNLTLNAQHGTITLENDVNVVLTKGNLVASAAGDILEAYLGFGTAQGAFQVGGTSSFSSANYSVQLGAAANQFVGAVSLSDGAGGGIGVYNSQALVLGTVAAPGSGGVTVTANGSITGAGSVSAAGEVQLYTAFGSNGSILLSGPFAAGGGLVALADGSGALSIPAIGGNLTVLGATAGGGITLGNSGTGALTLQGSVTGVPGAGGQAAGAVNLTGSTLEVDGGIATGGGNLTLTSTAGAVTATTSLNTTAATNTGTASGSITVTAATSVTLQNVSTVGASNTYGVGSNAAAVTIEALAGDLNVGAINTGGGNAVSGGAANRNGGNAGNIALGAPGHHVYLNGDLTAVGGSPTGTSTQGLGGYVELQSPAVLTGDRLVDTGTTSGDVTFLSTVDSDGTPRALRINAGIGSVTFERAVGGIAPLSGLTVASAQNVSLQANVTTDSAAGITIADSGTLYLAAETGPKGTSPITIDTSAGNGPVTISSLTTELMDNVTFTRGTGLIYFGGYLYSAPGQRSNLTFNGAGGGSIWVDRDVGGSYAGSGYALGDISVATASDLTLNWNVVASSLVATNDTGRIAIGITGGNGTYQQYYDGALGLQLRTDGSNSNYGGAADIGVYGSVTATAAGAPISITASSGQVYDYNNGTLSTAGGDITLSGTYGVNVSASYAGFVSNNGAISLLSSNGTVTVQNSGGQFSSGSGDITLSAPAGVNVYGSYTNFTTTSGAINLLASAGQVVVYDYNSRFTTGTGSITLSGQTGVTISTDYANFATGTGSINLLSASGAVGLYDYSSLFTTGGGDITVSGAAGVTLGSYYMNFATTGTGALTLTSSAGTVNLNNYDSTLSTDAGAMTLDGATGVQLSNNYLMLSTGSGPLTLTSSGGSVGTTNYYYTYDDSLTSTSGNISLRGNGVTFGGYYYNGPNFSNVVNAGSGKIRIDGGGGQVLVYGALETTDADSGGTPAILISDAAAPLSGGPAVVLSSAIAQGGTLRIGQLVGGVADVTGDVQQFQGGDSTNVIDIHTLEIAATGSIQVASYQNTIDQLGNISLGGSLDVEAVGRTSGMALTGDITATDVTIRTGNGPLALNDFSVTSTTGNVLLQGEGLTQSAASTVTSAGTVTLIGADYVNSRYADVVLAGSVVAADTGNAAVSVLDAGAVQLGNVVAGTAGNRGGLVLGSTAWGYTSYYGYYYSDYVNGNITQAPGTGIQVGQVSGQQTQGSTTLTSPTNEIGSLAYFNRGGDLSVYDADTEHNGLVIGQNALDYGNTSGAVTVETGGALQIAGNVFANGVVLSGTGITDAGFSPYVQSTAGLELRAHGGDVTLGGNYYAYGGNFQIRGAGNVQLGNTYASGELSFGAAGQAGVVAQAQPVAAAGALTLDGGGLPGGPAQRVAIASSGNDAGVTFTVTGTDMFGRPATETIVGSNAGTAIGSQYFASVTQVTASGAAAGTVAVGTATETVAGNVTQTGYASAAGVTGVVGGALTLTNPNNYVGYVGALATGGNLSLYTQADGPVAVTGAVSSSAGNVRVDSYYGIDVQATGSISATGAGKGITLLSDQPYYYTGVQLDGALAAGTGGVTINTAAAFANSATGTIDSAGVVSIRASGGGTGYGITLGGDITAGAAGIQMGSGYDITQTGGVLTTPGAFAGIGEYGGTPNANSPSAFAGVSLTDANHVGTLGSFYLSDPSGGAFRFNNTGGALRVTGAIATSNGDITIQTTGGALALGTASIGAGELGNGANVVLGGLGITQSAGSVVSATGSSDGVTPGNGAGGGTITLLANDGSGNGAVSLLGTLTTQGASGAAVSILGAASVVLPTIAAPNGGLVLGDSTNPQGHIAGPITQGVGTALDVQTLNVDADSSAVLTNAGNQLGQLGRIAVGNNPAVQYDFDLYNSLNGLTLSADVNSQGGVRIVTIEGATGSTGTLALGGHNVYASGDVYLGGQGVTQDAGSTVDANHSGTAGSGGNITVDGGGGTNNIALNGVLTTDGAGKTLAIVDATNATLGVVSATAGTVALGTAALPLTGAVGQVPESGVIDAHTLTGNAGTLTVTASNLDDVGPLTTTGALTLADQGGLGAPGLALTGAVRVGASSSIQTTDGVLALGAFGIDATGQDLVLAGVGISQGTGSALKANTAEISAGTGSIDLFSPLNAFSGEVTVGANGDHVALQAAGQLYLNTFTGEIGPATSITAWAGTNLLLSQENITTTSGSLEFRSLNGNLSTPGNLTTDSGSIALYASGAAPGNGNILVANSIATGTGNVTIEAANRVNLSASVTSTAGDLAVTGGSVVHVSSTPDSPLRLATGGAGTITVDATGSGFAMGDNFNYQSDTGAITIASAGTALLGNISSNGQVSVTSVGAVSQQTGSALVAGALAVQAGANGAVTLANTANQVGAVSLQSLNGASAGAGALSFYDAGPVAVRQLQTTSTAVLVAGGAVTTDAVGGPGTVTAASLAVKTLSDAGAGVTLDSAGNDVGTLTLLSRNAADTALAGGTLRYTDANGFTVAGVGTTGSAVLTTGGAVTQTGAIIAGGLGLLGTGSFQLNLANVGGTPANQVGTLAAALTGSLTFTDVLALTVGSVNPTGITSGGGAVTLVAPSISSVGYAIDTRGGSPSMSGGAVTLTTTGAGAAGELATGAIYTSGTAGTPGNNGGNAGAITLTASGDSLALEGPIQARGAAGGNFGSAGSDGIVALSAVNGAVTQADGGHAIDAGRLTLVAANASALLDTGNTIDFVAANLSGAGQGFAYRSASNYTVAGNGVVSGLRTQGGAIDLSGSDVVVTVAEPVTTRGGAFTATGIAGFDSSATTLATAGDGTYAGGVYASGGTVDIQTAASGGAVTLGAIDSRGDARSATANGGAVTLASVNTLTTAGIQTNGAGPGSGGAVSLQGGTAVRLGGSIATGGGNATAAGGDITVSGPAVLAGTGILLNAGTGAGNVQFNGTLDSDGTPRSLSVLAGTGTIAFAGAVGGTSALDSLLLRSNHAGAGAITQGAGAPIVAASLGLQAGGDVVLANPGNLIGTLAAQLSHGAALTLVDAGGITLGTVSSVDGSVTLAGLGDGTGSSAVSLTAGGPVTQTAQGVITLNGSLTIDTSAFSAGNVAVTNAAAGGTVLGNTLVAGNLTLDSTGPITQLANANGPGVDAWLRVGGSLTTPTSTLTESLNSSNYFAGGAPGGSGNVIRMNGVISLSMNGAGGLVATDGTHTVTIAAAALASGVTVISDAGGQSITVVANASAVSLTQANKIGGALSITTAGTYSGGGTANPTGIVESTALDLPGAATFVVQPTTWTGTPPAGFGEILLDRGTNVFGGTVTASARGLDVALADSALLTLGDVVAGQLVLSPGAGVTQAANTSITAGQLAIAGTGSVLLTGANHVGTVAASENGALTLQFAGVETGAGGTVQVGTVTPFDGGGALAGLHSNGHAIQLGSAVGLALGAAVDSGAATTTIGAVGEGLQLSADGSGGAGGLVLANADLANIHAGATTFTTTGAQDLYVSGVTLPASLGTVTLQSGQDVQVATGPGATGVSVAGNLTVTAAAGTGTVTLGDLGAGHPTLSGGGTIALQGDGGVTLANLTTTNGAITVTGPTTLGADTLLSSGSGAVTFAGTVDGAHGLTVDSGGTTTFNGAVGGTTPLASLTTDAGGTTVVAGGGVTTQGAQSYGDALVLGAAATRLDSAAGGGHLGFTSIDGNASGQSLVLDAGSGTIQVSGAVGAGQALAGLTVVDSAGTTFQGAVTAGAVTLTDTQGAIAFDAALNAASLAAAAGGFDLTLAGNATVTGATTLANTGHVTLGQTAASVESFGGGLSLAGPTAVTLAGTIGTTNAALDLGAAPVTLATDVTLSTGTAALSLGGTVDGAHALTLDSQGVTTLGGALGGTARLTALTTDAGGSTVLGGGTLSVGGALTLDDAVSLTQATTLTAGSVTTGATLAAGAHDLTVLADTLALGGAVSGSGHLTLAPATAGRTVGVAGGAGALSLGTATWNDIGAGFTDVTVGSATAGQVTVGTAGSGVALPNATILASGAGVDVVGNATIGGAFLRIDAATASTDSGLTAGSGGLQTVGAGALRLDGTAPNTYAGTTTIGSGATLQVVADGALAGTAAVRNAGTLDLSGSNGVTTATVTGAGAVQLGGHGLTLTAADGTLGGVVSGSGGSLTLTGGALTLAGSNTYTGTTTIGGGTLTATNSQSLGTAAGGTTVAAGGTLALDGSGGAITLGDALTLSGTGAGGSGALRNVAGANTLTGTVTLGSGAVLVTAPAGSLAFAGTVDGPAALTVDATGAVAFQAAVGGSTALASLTTDAGGSTSLRNVTTTGAQSYGDDVTLGGTTYTTTNAAFGVAGSTTLAADATVTTGSGAVTFTGAVDGAHALAVDSSGATRFAAAVGGGTALSSLTTDAGGTSSVQGVTTIGAQHYGDNVTLNGRYATTNAAFTAAGTTTLAGDATVATGSGAVDFAGAVDGAHALAVTTTGAASLDAAVGAATALASVTVSGGTVSLHDVTTTGAQAYTGPTTTHSSYRTAGGSVAFNSAVTIDADLAIDTTGGGAAGGNVSFAGTLASSPAAANGVTVTAGTGTLSVAGAATVSGVHVVSAGGATLANAANSFGTLSAAVGAGGLTVRDTTGLDVTAAGVTSRGGNVDVRTTSGNLTLDGAVTASGGGNVLLAAATGNFVNHAGAGGVAASGGGRWVVYSTDPAQDTRGGLVPQFKVYNASLASTLPDATAGEDGFVYTVAPVVTAVLTGTVEKTYNDNTVATLAAANYTTTGAIDGDLVTLNNPTTGSYDNKNAGSGKTVTVNGIALASASNGAVAVYGYQLANTTATAANGLVDKADLTVAGLVALNKVYDGTDTATFSIGSAVATGVYQGDSITIDSVTGVFDAGKNVGTGKSVTATQVVLSGPDLGNYQLTPVSGLTASITPRPLTITATGNDKAYDGTTVASVTLADNRVAGDSLSEAYTANFLDPAVGNNKFVNVDITGLGGADAGNYTYNTTAATYASIVGQGGPLPADLGSIVPPPPSPPVFVPVNPPTSPEPSLLDATLPGTVVVASDQGVATVADTPDVWVRLLNKPAGRTMGRVMVLVPHGLTAFVASLPNTLYAGKSRAELQQAQMQLDGGGPLPGWLKFDPKTMSLSVRGRPAGAPEVDAVLSVGGERTVVAIEELGPMASN